MKGITQIYLLLERNYGITKFEKLCFDNCWIKVFFSKREKSPIPFFCLQIWWRVLKPWFHPSLEYVGFKHVFYDHCHNSEKQRKDDPHSDILLQTFSPTSTRLWKKTTDYVCLVTFWDVWISQQQLKKNKLAPGWKRG